MEYAIRYHIGNIVLTTPGVAVVAKKNKVTVFQILKLSVPAFILSVLSVAFLYNGVPRFDRWVPGLRFDVSGLALIPGTHKLLEINDRGKLVGFGSIIHPVAMVLNLDQQPRIGRFSLSIDPQINVPRGAWDAEAAKCIKRPRGGVGCVLTSGRRNEALWLVAESSRAATHGDFTLSRLMKLQTVTTNENTTIPPVTQFEAIVFLDNGPQTIRVLMLTMFPSLNTNGESVYWQYLLEFDDMPSHGKDFQLRIIGQLSSSICKLPHPEDIQTIKLSALTRSDTSGNGILTCTGEDAPFSYLRPVNISKHGITLKPRSSAVKITPQDFDGAPPPSIKIEGLTCLDGDLIVAVDPDTTGGGVYRMNERISALCH